MSQTQNPVIKLQAKVTKTAAFNGAGIDISAYPTQGVGPLVTIRVDSLTAGKTAVFALQDSVDAFSSDTRTVFTFTIQGVADSRTPRTRDIHAWEMAGVRYGVSSATMRLVLLSIDASSSVDYEGFIQGQL